MKRQLSLLEIFVSLFLLGLILGAGILVTVRFEEVERDVVLRLSRQEKVNTALDQLCQDLDQAYAITITKRNWALMSLGVTVPSLPLGPVDRPGLTQCTLQTSKGQIEWREVEVWPEDLDHHLIGIRDDPAYTGTDIAPLIERIPTPSGPDRRSHGPSKFSTPRRLLQRRVLNLSKEPPGGWSPLWNGVRRSESPERFRQAHELWVPTFYSGRESPHNGLSLELIELRILARHSEGQLLELPHNAGPSTYGDGQSYSQELGVENVGNLTLSPSGRLMGFSPGGRPVICSWLYLQASSDEAQKLKGPRAWDGSFSLPFRVTRHLEDGAVSIDLEDWIVLSQISVTGKFFQRLPRLTIELKVAVEEGRVVGVTRTIMPADKSNRKH